MLMLMAADFIAIDQTQLNQPDNSPFSQSTYKTARKKMIIKVWKGGTPYNTHYNKGQDSYFIQRSKALQDSSKLPSHQHINTREKKYERRNERNECALMSRNRR